MNISSIEELSSYLYTLPALEETSDIPSPHLLDDSLTLDTITSSTANSAILNTTGSSNVFLGLPAENSTANTAPEDSTSVTVSLTNALEEGLYDSYYTLANHLVENNALLHTTNIDLPNNTSSTQSIPSLSISKSVDNNLSSSVNYDLENVPGVNSAWAKLFQAHLTLDAEPPSNTKHVDQQNSINLSV